LFETTSRHSPRDRPIGKLVAWASSPCFLTRAGSPCRGIFIRSQSSPYHADFE
jgi:hypothetical protein